ncbi:glycosyltransferase family 2 protein [Emticicia sp.]|uniref:glycosyltransferase family 2 protein n=1 Tax=Emticicia sp. TaxID=1930953 RepID=UPI00375280C5
MKVTGFTIVRNAIKYDYPVLEAITSILPLCDEFVVAVGNSEDGTLDLIKSIKSDKIRIIETIWDDSLRKDGKVLAIETDKALAAVSDDTTWAFYIQSDEIVHEKYHQLIKDAMLTDKDNLLVEGLLFKYTHFYGSYKYVADSRKWYRNEIRIIRNTKNVLSYKDAQGFRKRDNTKLKVKSIDAYIYHYGWVKPPSKMTEKIRGLSYFWHTDQELDQQQPSNLDFDYSGIDSLTLFEGTHPKVIQPRINNMSWAFDFNIKQKKYSLKNLILMKLEKLTGWRIGEYQNYINL